jgi:hypothetical protein
METGEELEVSTQFASGPYKKKIRAHIDELRSLCQGAGLSYYLSLTDQPLDAALREYLSIRAGRF